MATELSKRVKPEIRENLLKAIETLKNSKSCILRDSISVQCAGDTIFIDSVSRTKKNIEPSTGQLQRLFIKFNDLNQEALKQIQSLVGVKDANQQVINAVCTLYNKRTELIQAYFAQQSTNPVVQLRCCNRPS